MLFEILTGQGNVRAGNRKAVVRQTQQEHNNYLDPKFVFPEDYARIQMLEEPMRSIMMRRLEDAAKEYEEKDIVEYWDDNSPRRSVTNSSSWVGNINYDPETRQAGVTIGDKIYTYVNVSPDEMAKLLNEPSIGHVLAESRNRHRNPGNPGEINYHSFYG